MDNHLRPDCVDAETLAMWAERALPPAQAALVEAHVADCERCQQLVATFAMTDDVVSTPPLAAAIPFWRQWWVPLTGVAAAAAITSIFVLRFAATTTEPVVTQTAQAAATAPLMAPATQPESTPPAAQTTTPASEAANTRAANPARVEAAPAKSGAETAPKTPTVRATKPTAIETAPAPKPMLAEPAAAPTQTAPATLTAAAAPPPPPPPAPVPVASPPPPPPAPRAMPPGGVVGGVTGGLAAMPLPTAGVRIGATSTPPVELRADTAAANARDAWTIVPIAQFSSQLNFGAGRGGGGASAVAAVTTSAPRVVTYWRIVSATRVARSNDAKTWTPVDLTALGDLALTAGAAPTADVCWLVGKNGLVLRTTDAKTFVKVASPEAADLQSVTSVLALDATVATSTGHRYRTTDGGVTWVVVK